MAMMKSSNTEWLGDIPTEWDVAQVGNYYELRNEKVSDYDFEPLSVTMKGIVPQLATAAKSDDHSNRKLVKKGDFVINSRSDRRGSCGISLLDGSVSLINIVMEPRGEMNPQYYNWLFHTEQFADEFYKWGHGIVDDLWTTRWQEMKKILIVAPSPDEQQAIADYLDETCSKIDEIIAEAKASIDEYKELKQSVIFEAVTKGLDKNVEMKDSGVEWIGNIPSSWQLRKLKTFTVMISKGTTPKDMSNVKTALYCIRYLKSENIKNNHLDIVPEFYITEETNNELSRSKLNCNDILFVIAGASIGKVAIIDENLLPANTNQANAFIRIKDEFMDSIEYLWMLLQSVIVKEVINRYSVQSAQPNISMENLGNIKLPYPLSKQERDNIMNYLREKNDTIDSLITEKESLVNDLEAYKKSLIYEVVTGKRRVV